MRRAALVVSVVVTALVMAFAVQSATVHYKPKVLYSDAPYALVGLTQRDSGSGCASCHGATAEATMTVAISGASTAYPGQLSTYTITASRGVGTNTYNGARMGAALAASDGAVLSVHSGEPMRVGPFPSPGGGTVASNEVIHDVNVGALHAFNNGSASYQFDFTMPASAAIGTTHTIYGVSAAGCNTVNPCAGWRHAAPFVVTTIAPGPPANLAAGATSSGGVPLSWTASSEASAAYRVVYKPGSVAPASPTDGTAVDLGTVTSTTVGGLNPLTTYTFTVYSKVTYSFQTTYSTTAPSVTASTQASTSYYVNVATGSDSNNGTSSATPFKTVTKGMSSAADGDAINVAPGTYNAAAGEVFPITIFSGRRLVSTSGAGVTIIDASDASPRTRVLNVTGASTTLVQGFTITGGSFVTTSIGSNSFGGGIFCGNGDASTLSRNIVTGNQVSGYSGNGGTSPSGGQAYGGGIYLDFGAKTVVVDNIISNNVASGGPGFNQFPSSNPGGGGGGADGGGVYAVFGTVTLVNNTFFGNQAIGGPGGSSPGSGGAGGNGTDGGAAISTNSIARNNIFLDNSTSGGAGGTGTPHGAAGSGFVGGLNTSGGTGASNNLFFGNTASGAASDGNTGASPVLADPLVHSPFNLHLRYSSPAIGAGTASGAPSTDFDGTARANPPSIGAYEASTLTAASTNCATPATGVTTTLGSTGVAVNLSSVNGSVCADLYSTGRTGTVPTSNASVYFWTVSTTATSLSGSVTFDWGGITNNGVGNPTTVQLLRRSGGGTPWQVVSSVTRSGTAISTNVTGFSDFALGGLLAASSTSMSSSSPTSTYGQSVTFTATVTAAGATGSVTFLDGATTLGTASLAAGTAAFSIASLAVGSHSITASYGGDGAYGPSTSSAITQTVNKASTSTALMSAVNPSLPGQLVTFTITVTPSAATGNVTLFDGTATVGTTALAGGSATIATSTLTNGTHSMTATYAGDANYTASTSSVLSQVVSANAVHGDANGDGQVNAADVFYLLNYLFAGGNAPVGFADCNADGKVNALDVFYLVNHLFAGGPAPM